MFRLNKKIVMLAVVLLFFVALIHNSQHITGFFYANLNWERDWEDRIVVKLEGDVEYYEGSVVFGVYKPKECIEGIFVTDGIRDIDFVLFDEEYVDDVCQSTGIRIKNPLYSERRISISPTVVEEPVRRITITGRSILSPFTIYIYYGRITVGVVYNKIQNDPEFDVTIYSKQLINNTLEVVFYHNSDIERTIKVEGNVNYNLSSNVSESYQNVTLTIEDWSEEYFQLIVE